jgi:hypothetical protein
MAEQQFFEPENGKYVNDANQLSDAGKAFNVKDTESSLARAEAAKPYTGNPDSNADSSQRSHLEYLRARKRLLEAAR